MGRPSVYSEDLASAICGRLADGESLRSICETDDMPARSTVYAWLTDDVDGFSDRYARARTIQAETIADELIEIADDNSRDVRVGLDGRETPDFDHIARSRLRVDTRKWLLSKMLPKQYGEKTQMELTGKDGGPVEVESARERIARRIAGLTAAGPTGGDPL